MLVFQTLCLAVAVAPRGTGNGQDRRGQASTPHKQEWRLLAALNLLTAVIFVTYFLALRHLEPAVAVALGCGVGPVFALLIKIRFRPSLLLAPGNAAQGLAAAGVIGGIAVLLGSAVSIGVARSARDWTVGVASAIGCGILMVCFTLLSKRLALRGWKTREVLAHRWYALVAGALLSAPSEGWGRLADPDVWSALAMISVFGTAVPLYLLQEGIIRTSTINVSLLLATLPAVTVVFQLLDSGLTFSWATAAGVALITLFGWLGVLSPVATPEPART